MNNPLNVNGVDVPLAALTPLRERESFNTKTHKNSRKRGDNLDNKEKDSGDGDKKQNTRIEQSRDDLAFKTCGLFQIMRQLL